MNVKKQPAPRTLGSLAAVPGFSAGRSRKKPKPDSSVTFHKTDGTAVTLHLEKLPAEIGTLLLLVGVAGILLPGPVGAPFLIAGGIALWPSRFAGAARWFERTAPNAYRHGMKQMDRFLTDLENRYPGTVKELKQSD